MFRDQETLDILSHSAALAAMSGLSKQAAVLTETISELVPDNDNVTVIQAVALIAKRRYDEAIPLLRDKVLMNDPKNSNAKAFLALAYHFAENQFDRDRISKEVIEANDDEEAIELVKRLAEA